MDLDGCKWVNGWMDGWMDGVWKTSDFFHNLIHPFVGSVLEGTNFASMSIWGYNFGFLNKN